MSYWFEPTTVSFDVGGRTMHLESGRVAKQAHGSVLVTYGDTCVLVTATRSKPRPGGPCGSIVFRLHSRR